MNFRKIILSVCCIIPFFTVSACGNEPVIKSQNELTEIKLSWWGNDTRNEYTIAAVERFQQLYPDIKVKCSYSEWSGYEARSRVQMNSDTEADVMQINFGWLAEYSPDGNGYLDLNTVSEYLDLSNFSEDMLDYGMVNGILNAIPIAMNAETVYINKTIYESYGLGVPQTWDDLFTAAKVMNKDGVYPLSAASKSMWLYSITYAEQITGKKFLNEKGKLNFTPDDLQIMLDFYVKVINEKVFPQVEYYERINIDNGTYAGTVAWVSDAMNYCGSAINNGYEMTVADYTAFSPEQCGEGWCAKPATMYAISKNTDHPREAALLLNFLLNSQDMALLQGVEKGIPLSSSARKYLEAEDMLNGIQYEASLKMEANPYMSQMNPFVENSSLIDMFMEACNLVLYDRATSEEAAKKLYFDLKSVS